MAGATDTWIGTTDGKFIAVDANWYSATAIASGDAVVVPKTAAQDIDDSLDADAVTLVGFEVEEGADIAIGTYTAAGLIVPLKITMLDTGSYYDVTLAGSGETFLQVTDYANIFVTEAPEASSSNYGLNLTGLCDGDASCLGLVFITAETGTISLAANPGEVFEAEAISITGAEVTLGEGVVDPDGSSALPLLTINGGTVITRCATTVLNVTDSEYRHENGAITTLNVKGGTAVIAGAMTIATANVEAGATLDMTGDLQAKTLSAVHLHEGSTLDYRGGHVTVTAIHLDGCALQEVTILTDAEPVPVFA